MQTLNSTFPDIADSDLQAARDFLNVNSTPKVDLSSGNARRKLNNPHSQRHTVTVHHGITRARGRSGSSKAQV